MTVSEVSKSGRNPGLVYFINYLAKVFFINFFNLKDTYLKIHIKVYYIKIYLNNGIKNNSSDHLLNSKVNKLK